MVQHQGWISGRSLRGASGAMAVVLVLGALAIQSAQAQTFTVLYSFTGGLDGGYSSAGVIRDATGNLYGTTREGGDNGNGVVFELHTNGRESVLYRFAGGMNDGGVPYAPLVRDKEGNLYGTTSTGGTGNGVGTVFKVDTSGTETILHTFTGNDGAAPYAGLTADGAGNFYGTTYSGGRSEWGTVFKSDAKGELMVLHSFTGLDGKSPWGEVVRDSGGNLYGTTLVGGTSSHGVVFKLDAGRKETVLHSFRGYPRDGSHPLAGLVRDEAGNLYGTTIGGGSSYYGIVFKVEPSGKETVLHNFKWWDGANPGSGVVRDKNGDLYGVTENGGSGGGGVVYKLNKNGKLTVLHNFTGSDGLIPTGGLLRDKNGNLYGTAQQGGTYNYGTVWKLTP